MAIQLVTPASENINNKFGDNYPNNDKPIYGHRVADILSFLPDQTREQYNTNQRSNVMTNEDNSKIDPKNYKTAREYELALSNVYENEIKAKLALQDSNTPEGQIAQLNEINKSLRLSEGLTNNVSSTTLAGGDKALFLTRIQNNFQYMLKLRAAVDKLLSVYGTRLSFGKNFVNSSGRAGNIPDYNDPRIERSIEACAIILYQLVSIGAIKANDELDIQGININTGQIELDPGIIDYNRQAKKLKLPLKGVFLINDRITNVDNRYATFTGVDLKATYALGYKVGNLKGLSQMTWSIHRGKPDAPVGDEIAAVNRARGRRCLPSSEKVYIQSKGFIPLNTVEVGDMVQSTPTQFNKVLGVYNQGRKNCNKIKLRNGYDLIASYDHPIYTERGWINTSELLIGDLVHTSGSVPLEDKEYDINDDMLKLIAYLIGDGSIHTYPKPNNGLEYRIELSISDIEMNTIGLETEEILNRLNIPFTDSRKNTDKCIKRRISVCTSSGQTDWRLRVYNELHSFLLNYNLYNTFSSTKFIPNEFVANLSKRQTSLFLSRLFSTDGCYSINGENDKYIDARFSSTSELLIDQIRLLLTKFNINCIKSLHRKVGDVGGREDIISRFNSYELTISNSLELTKFIRFIGIFSKQHLINDKIELIKSRIVTSNLEIDFDIFLENVKTILIERNESYPEFFNKYNLYKKDKVISVKHALKLCKILNDPILTDFINTKVEELINKPNNEFLTFPVISNEVIGELDVFDLEVEERHSFICEFMLVHNTIAGTMIFNIFDEHPITAIYPHSFFPQDQEKPKNPQAPVRESFIKPDQIPAFDITLILTNEYGYASIMTIFGVEIMDDGGGVGMNDLVNEEIIQYTAKDIDLLHSVKVDKNGMIDPYDLTNFNESEIWNRRTQIYQAAEGKTFQERYDEYVNR